MLIYELYGNPRPQKQTQFTKKGWAYDPSKKDLLQLQWQLKGLAPKEPLLCKVWVCAHFFLPIPKSVSKAVRRQMENGTITPSRPDTSNMYYLIENACKGIIYKDDCQVDDLCAHRKYTPDELPKILLRVIPINKSEKVFNIECQLNKDGVEEYAS